MYKTNFVGDDGEIYLRTLNIKPENHYFAPGDTIKFDKAFIKKEKSSNNFVE